MIFSDMNFWQCLGLLADLILVGAIVSIIGLIAALVIQEIAG